MIRTLLATALVGGLGLGLSACGADPGTRAVSGGLLGAGTGAAIGSFSGDAGKGALIGGGVGALGGALTAPRY